MGLFTMRERVALVDGRFGVTSEQGIGTRVAVEIPFRPSQEGTGGRGVMTEDLIRVVLADDHAVVLAGLRAVLGAAREIEIVGEARDGVEAMALVERLDPDVLVMDLSMPEMDGARATTMLTSKGVRTRILILTMHEEEDYLVPLLNGGRRGLSHEERGGSRADRCRAHRVPRRDVRAAVGRAAPCAPARAQGSAGRRARRDTNS